MSCCSPRPSSPGNGVAGHSPREALSNQRIGWCCIDRLSWHGKIGEFKQCFILPGNRSVYQALSAFGLMRNPLVAAMRE
jgi:hypothetical protein